MLQKLNDRRSVGRLRTLAEYQGIDFCSNDYLGLTQKPLEVSEHVTGSTGSRLISGHSQAMTSLEEHIANFHGFEAALLFNSGFDANLGLLSCLGQRGDIYLCDELIHASVIDGVRLSHATRVRFKHNCLHDLEEKLAQKSQSCRGQIYVLTESVFSMDGDIAPLEKMAALCAKYQAELIVDEAHGVGVYGDQGRGLVAALSLQDEIFACTYAFGKAVGLHGAVIAGAQSLKDYLINFCRPLIYSTAPAPSCISLTRAAYARFAAADHERAALFNNITHMRQRAAAQNLPNAYWLDSESPIQGLVIAGEMRVKQLAAHLQAQDIAVKAIVSPTVPEGEERIRINIHAHNSMAEIDHLLDSIEAYFLTEKAA